MSEAELYLIRQRMLSGKLAKAERGELAVPLPIGYVRRPSGEVVLDPDEQAQHVVRLVFGTFRRLGTLNAVLRYLVEQRGPAAGPGALPGRPKGELEWRRPTRETLQNMLHDPVCAGYFAWGSLQDDPRRKAPGRPSTARVVKDSTVWLGPAAGQAAGLHHRGASTRRTSHGWPPTSRPPQAPGAPRNGAALLSGLLRCGRSGKHRMAVSYPDARPPRGPRYGYTCAFYQVNYGTGGRCQHIAGPALDDYVTGQVLDAVAPAALEVSMAAAAQAEDERAMLDKLWRQRLERARYAADRARRQYQLAEPENRLVTRQLEAGWEAALAEAARLEADYQRFTEQQPATLTAAERTAIQALSADLPRVWDAPSTTPARPQGAAAHPHRGHHRRRRRGQRAGRRHHHLGRRAPDRRAGRPPRRPPGPAVVLPRPAGSRHRARRSGPHQPADRRRPQRRGIPAAQTDQPVHRRAGPHPDHPARHPRPAGKAGPPCSPACHQANGRSPACPPSWACPPPASITGSTAAGSPPGTPPGTRNWIITAEGGADAPAT